MGTIRLVILADWLKVLALIGVGAIALYIGRQLVGKLEELRAEQARGSDNLTAVGNNLVQVGTDLNELLDRIATAAEAGDPVQADVDAAKALADGLATTADNLLATSGRIDAILAAPEPPPGEPPVEPTP